MSQQAVERTIGKLVTDARFRDRFFENPAAATWEAGLPLSPGELEELSLVPRAAVTQFGESLGPRIIRLCLDAPNARGPTGRVGGDDAGTEGAA